MSNSEKNRTDKEIKALAASDDTDIDTSEVSEVTDWDRAIAGRFYDPDGKRVTILRDIGLSAWFPALLEDLCADQGWHQEPRRELRSFAEGFLEHLKTGEPAVWSSFQSDFTELLVKVIRSRSHSLEAREAFIRLLEDLQTTEEATLDQTSLGRLINSVCNKVRMEFYHSRGQYMSDYFGEAFDPGPELYEQLITKKQQAYAKELLAQLQEDTRHILYAFFDVLWEFYRCSLRDQQLKDDPPGQTD